MMPQRDEVLAYADAVLAGKVPARAGWCGRRARATVAIGS